MPAGYLRDLLRAEIEVLLPVGALHAAKIAEESERKSPRALGRAHGGGRSHEPAAQRSARRPAALRLVPR